MECAVVGTDLRDGLVRGERRVQLVPQRVVFELFVQRVEKQREELLAVVLQEKQFKDVRPSDFVAEFPHAPVGSRGIASV